MLIPDTTLIIGNWKMNPASKEEALSLSKHAVSGGSKVTVIICPPDIYLETVREHKERGIILGAQGFFAEEDGSMTGETSLIQLQSLGVSYVIIGHSSQRAVGETDKAINTKIFACLEHDIIPIVCVGEKERDVDGTYLTFLQDQIRATFAGLGKPDFENIIIAYEPIWAIGIEAKKQATPAEFESSLIFIKKVIQDMTGNLPVGKIHIVYGGSVSAPAEARSYVDVGARGVLIGRASLDATVFNSIIKEFS